MQAKRRYQHGTAIPVVARMVDVLKPQRRIDSSPHMQGVVALYNVFPDVVESSVAQKKSRSRVKTKCKFECRIFTSSFPSAPPASGSQFESCSLNCI